MNDLAPVRRLLEERCGLLIPAAREPTLRDAVRNGCRRIGARDAAAYATHIRTDDAEFVRLVNAVTINESYFFREHAPIRLLARRLVPAILGHRSAEGRQVRILSAGCAAGEEPYSLAMELVNHYGPGVLKDISVTAVDVDRDVIRAAREGRYKPAALRAVRRGDGPHCFIESGDDCSRIGEPLRGTVSFHAFNLRDESYPAFMRDMDIILYRNVSIYFTPAVRAHVFARLADCLRPGGYLLTGAAETFGHRDGPLDMVEVDGHFLFHRPADPLRGRGTRTGRATTGGGVRRSPDAVVRTGRAHRNNKAAGCEAARTAGRASPEQDRESVREIVCTLARSGDYGGARARIDEALDRFPDPRLLALKASIALAANDFAGAAEAAEAALASDAWCTEAHLAMGTLARLRGDDEEALRHFRYAVYCSPACWLAHLGIARICRRRGDSRMAFREFAVTAKLLKGGTAEGTGYAFFPTAYAPRDIVHLCEQACADLAFSRGEHAGRADGVFSRGL